MSSFGDIDKLNRPAGGFGKPKPELKPVKSLSWLSGGGGIDGSSGYATTPLDRQFIRDEAEDTLIERNASDDAQSRREYEDPYQAFPSITNPDELNNLARNIRLMPGTLSCRLQQELPETLPRRMPYAIKHLLIRRLWQVLFLWSINKHEKANQPPLMSPVSMTALEKAMDDLDDANKL